MFGEPVIVKNGKHQGLIEGVGVGKIFELEGLVEERIESFPVNFCLKLLDPLRLRHQEDLRRGVRLLTDQPSKIKILRQETEQLQNAKS